MARECRTLDRDRAQAALVSGRSIYNDRLSPPELPMKDLEAKVQYLIDLEEIKMLKYRYCLYNDGGWPAQPLSHQGPAADLYTEDGVWDGGHVAKAQGREEIRKLFASMAALPMAYHAVTNPIIEIDGDTARGHWHLISGSVGKAKPSTAAKGSTEFTGSDSSFGFAGYQEEYVRTPEGWRIKSTQMIYGRRTVLPNGWQQVG
jgi:hypothetical protein